MSMENVYRIKEYPAHARPRERMERLGAAQLTDQELLAILLATGSKTRSALDLAGEMFRRFGGLAGFRQLTLTELTEQKGVGLAKAATVAAAVEFGRRVALGDTETMPVLNSPADAAAFLMERMRGLDREHFQVLLLNQKNQLLALETVSIGTLSGAPVHPREVFKQAIKRSAASMIVAHNHPSGNCQPSEVDRQVTARLSDAGRLLGIEVLDHLIIGADSYYSFCEDHAL